ncbi:MAG: DUF1997 domain-containing protein [Leptolyngbyaceae cyanobacterium MAG.088]|nr:DUF1997 domain-containing protein [Leptolyngbyaceae cyanobacterium MAG.088]
MNVSSTQYSQSSILNTSPVSTSSQPPAQTDREERQSAETIIFEGYYVGNMEMFADVDTVANYLDSHQGWFTRCAQPMDVKPIGHNGYAISLGRFGSLNFQIQPKIGLHLLPQNKGVYRIETIPVPGHDPEGYDVDFRAAMSLAEKHQDKLPVKQATHVEWELNLQTKVQMPKFIQALPQSLVKASGDKLLNQIVRQISKRLTHKVQEDFHTMMNLPLPGRKTKH